MQVNAQNLGKALDLLQAGMPDRTPAFWRAGIERILEQGENRALGVPLGEFMMAQAKPVGVIFTIASTRRGPDGAPRTLINLSTWYVDPQYRWRAPLMLQRIVSDASRFYTSLTPTVSVQQILQSLGFSPINDGIAITCIPLAALNSGGSCRVVELEALAAGALAPETAALMASHRRLGCIAIAFRHDERWRPLLLKSRSLKGIPALRVIYSENDAALHACIGPVCRHLLRHRRPLLIMDKPTGAAAPGLAFPNHGRALMKGACPAGTTDHSGSELVYFDF